MAVKAEPKPRKKNKTRYELRHGFRLPVSGEVVAETIEGMKKANGGTVEPRQVFAESIPEEAPLHSCFEMDKEKAWWECNTNRARYIIRSYEVIIERPDGEERREIANVAVYEAESEVRSYTSSSRVVREADLREQVVDEAERMLRGVVNRYQHLPGLKGLLLQAIERLGLTG